ncbi:class I SAM-dependent methyltransferase [Gallaecimonas sp. GXIMD4217]|uniref:class I SAM-dependent methyltransferase n=1 Tax=Gallaecimonas sp. GXIMD4217 TaxID=3131927 RepID=UPI00311AEC0C
MIFCPLCQHHSQPFSEDRRRAYFRCPACALVFADPAQRPTAAEEKAIYDTHENSPDDAGYRRFLGRLAQPLLDRLAPASQGLDYGCGPGPTLSLMLREAGHGMALYDPLYAPDEQVLDRQYDFVTCTEVVEHFHQPGRDWPRLVSLVRSGGWLGIMTKLVINAERFKAWHYKNDPTHVSFYSEATFDWLARRFDLTLTRVDQDVLLLQKR